MTKNFANGLARRYLSLLWINADLPHTKLLGLLLWASLWAGNAAAQDLQADLNEQVVTVVKKGALFSFELETTLYKPDGDGPFPIAVVNHGKAPGDPRFQARSRPASAVRFFLQRGYAVVVPMRQGFSKSTGSYIGGGCNVLSNGRLQADDAKAVLDWVITQPWADKDRMLVLGQSHGGWTTLSLGSVGYPGVKGLVNFAGGLRQESCPGWESNLARSAGDLGKDTKLPSLWFYGDNDSYFPPRVFKPMFEQYKAGGANAELVEFGNFGNDAHGMFGSRNGERIWQPKVTAFMQTVGLPTEVVHSKFGLVNAMAVPPKTDFADVSDEDKLPFVKEAGKTGYKNYLTRQLPRAFAIAPSGAWGWAEMGDDPLARALANCNRTGKGECKLYSVDDIVVWQP
jgi:dienelactone hydrolase